MRVKAWDLVDGGGPLIAVALHAGHEVRSEVATLMAVSDADRLREEDPATGDFIRGVPTRLVVSRSRFEVDLNRPRERAVYGGPEDAWGLEVWREPLPADVAECSLGLYDEFYIEMEALLDAAVARHGGFVVLDVHSYNHRRGGPGAEPDDPADNPLVNLGTATLDRARWAPVVDAFVMSVRASLGPEADIRENVKFRGGNLARWVHSRYATGCCLAIEFKKTYMDEWTGTVDPAAVARITDALAGACGPLAASLEVVLGRG
jgi:N-formylglutamate amidohydrolase